MDPFTQGVVGAAFAQLGARYGGKQSAVTPDVDEKARAKKDRNTSMVAASVIGALSGMAPDLDVLIRSSNDPLLALEYHRHFTHSLFFIPIGAAICACVFFVFLRFWRPLSFLSLYVWSLLGYATHALLDVCTSYGTQIFWPFSNFRASIDVISVIDPLFTIPCFLLLVLACKKRSRTFTIMAIAWGALYLVLGSVQHNRALQQVKILADSRGHNPVRITAKPSFANLIVWKGIYEHQGRFYIDGLRMGLSDVRVWSGDRVDKLETALAFPWLAPESQQARDIQRFTWFSDGYVALDPERENYVIDVRYSLVPNQVKALWGIELDESATFEEHVDYLAKREDSGGAAKILWRMITGDYEP